MEPDNISEVQQLTPTDFQSHIVYCQTKKLSPVQISMEFPSIEKARIFEKELEDMDRLESESQSSEEEEQDDLSKMKYSREVLIDEKEAYLLGESYAQEIRKIQRRLNVRIILTAKKIKIFSLEEDDLTQAQKEMRLLSQNIFVLKIQKAGREIHESANCHKQLEPIKTLEWKSAYYYYFDASRLDCEKAKEKMSKVNKLSHIGFFLMPKYDGPIGFMRPIRQLYVSHAKRHLFKENEVNKPEYQLEISTSSKRVLFHSTNQYFIHNLSTQFLNKLRNQNIVFFFKMHPKVTQETIDSLDKKIKKKSKENEYFQHVIQKYREFYTVGILISKKILKSLLADDKNSKIFGSIIQEIISLSQLTENSIYFYYPFKTQNLKLFFQNNFSKDYKVVGSLSQLIQLTPKLIEENQSQMYLKILKKTLDYKDQQTKDSTINMSISSTMNDTSIINNTSLNQTKMDKSILPSFIKNKFPQYKIHFDIEPVYAQMNENIQVDKFDKEMVAKIEELIGIQCTVRRLKINESLKRERQRGQLVSLFIQKSKIFTGDQCNLYKLKNSLETPQGYLIEVSVDNLKEQQKFYRAKTAQNYIPTHHIKIHLN